MNTLSRAVTAQIFPNSASYIQLRQHWSSLLRSEHRHQLTAAHHLLYLSLVGKDWRKGFMPITNQRKIGNGGFYNWGLFRALALFHSPFHDEWLLAPFDGFVTADMLLHIRQFVPKVMAYQLKAENFVEGQYPFSAYLLPNS